MSSLWIPISASSCVESIFHFVSLSVSLMQMSLQRMLPYFLYFAAASCIISFPSVESSITDTICKGSSVRYGLVDWKIRVLFFSRSIRKEVAGESPCLFWKVHGRVSDFSAIRIVYLTFYERPFTKVADYGIWSQFVPDRNTPNVFKLPRFLGRQPTTA